MSVCSPFLAVRNVDESEIKTLIQHGSGERVAFVHERSAKAALAETLLAFANTRGGVAVLGITRAGAVRGLRNPETEIEKALSAALQITPPLVLPIPVSAQIDGRVVVTVEVPDGLPHVYSLQDRYLCRDGAKNQAMKAAQVQELMVQRGVLALEAQVAAAATLEDLDWSQANIYANRLPGFQELEVQEILRRRGCIASEDGTQRPTIAGMLLFGRLPVPETTHASITAVRYAGTTPGDVFSREDIEGPLAAQIRRAEAFLLTHTTQRVSLEGLAREDEPAYPREVLREVIVNAVAHRDYAVRGESIQVFVFSDRIEIYSPGRLPGHVTIENMVRERFSRNPVIVQVLSDLGFVERLGYGIDRMLLLLEQEGYRPPRFEETSAGFRVTLYAKAPRLPAQPRAWLHLELNPRQERALDYVVDRGRIANREYQALCPDVSAETIRRDLSDLVHKDILIRIGRKRATYYILKDASLAKQ